MKKFIAVIMCIVMLCASLAACGSSAESKAETPAESKTEAAAESKEVAPAESEDASEESETADETAAEEAGDVELNILTNLGNTGTVLTFDPGVYNQGTASLSRGITETLFELNEDESDVEGILATGYEKVDDNTWKITLREGVQFSNGKDLTADDVKRCLEYETANNTYIANMLDIESMEADGLTLTIHTNNPVAILPKVLTSGATLIFDPDEMDDIVNHIIGTGAYILESKDGDGNCELVRNENYWRGMPKAARIHAKCGLDSAAVTNALQTGEILWGGISSADLSLFQDNPSYTVTETNNGRVFYLYLNTNYTFTQDENVREALQYAFNRDYILSGVYNSAGAVTNSIFPEWSPFHEDNPTEGYDPDKAAQILEDAGYTDSDGDGIREKDGEPLKLNITTYDSNTFPTLCEVLQQMLKAIGIDSDIKTSGAIVDDLTAGEYNIATYGYTTLTLGDCYNYLDPVYRTGGQSNFNGFSDPEVDAWLEELKGTYGTEARAELAKKIQDHIYAAHDHIYLMHTYSYSAVRSEVVTDVPVFGTNKNTGLYLWAIGLSES